MKIRTKFFGSVVEADRFQLPRGAERVRLQPFFSTSDGVLLSWEEPDEEERRWGMRLTGKVYPTLLGLFEPHDGTEGRVQRLIGQPLITFRGQGIALLGVSPGARILDIKIGTTTLGASLEPMPAELFAAGPIVLDKLGQLGIAEIGDIARMVDDEAKVGKLVEMLEAHTPFVCRAMAWPTCHLGCYIQITLEGRCRGAILWGLAHNGFRADVVEPNEDDDE